MLKESKNSKAQGNIGLGDAISFFTKKNYTVSIPLNDSQKYDLIVDIDNELKRVNVKTSYMKTKYGISQVSLRSNGGNQSGKDKYYFIDETVCDLIYFLNDDLERWLIPLKGLKSKRCINLGKKFDKYRL